MAGLEAEPAEDSVVLAPPKVPVGFVPTGTTDGFSPAEAPIGFLPARPTDGLLPAEDSGGLVAEGDPPSLVLLCAAAGLLSAVLTAGLDPSPEEAPAVGEVGDKAPLPAGLDTVPPNLEAIMAAILPAGGGLEGEVGEALGGVSGSEEGFREASAVREGLGTALGAGVDLGGALEVVESLEGVLRAEAESGLGGVTEAGEALGAVFEAGDVAVVFAGLSNLEAA